MSEGVAVASRLSARTRKGLAPESSGIDPLGDLGPDCGIVLERAADLKKWNAAAVENVGDLRHRARLAEGQPFARHLRAVAETVECGVVDGGRRRQVQDDDRHFGAAHDGQDGGGKSVGGDVQKDQVDVCPPEFVSGGESFLRGINQSEIENLNAGAFELARDLLSVSA